MSEKYDNTANQTSVEICIDQVSIQLWFIIKLRTKYDQKRGTENSNQNNSLSLCLTILKMVIPFSLCSKQLWDVVYLPVSLLNNAEIKNNNNLTVCSRKYLLMEDKTVSQLNSLLIKTDTLLIKNYFKILTSLDHQSKTMSHSIQEILSRKTCFTFTHPRP